MSRKPGSKRRVVRKPKPDLPMAWLDDLSMQVRLAKKQGLRGPLSITLEEADKLELLRDVVNAAKDLWDYHKIDLCFYESEYPERLKAALDRYRGKA